VPRRDRQRGGDVLIDARIGVGVGRQQEPALSLGQLAKPYSRAITAWALVSGSSPGVAREGVKPGTPRSTRRAASASPRS
jgi:hypothetical protein